jgi:hypothetical protein
VVLIPYAVNYRATARGSTPKLVKCEQCGFEYVYLISVTATGEGTSFLFLDNDGARARSRAAAEAELVSRLEGGISVVPCPECGHIQQHMVPLARGQRHAWMLGAWVPLLLIAGVLGLVTGCMSYGMLEGHWVAAVGWVIVVLLISLGVALPVWRIFLVRGYDPNADPVEQRKELGQKFAFPKELFVQAAPGEMETQEFCREVAATRVLWTVRDKDGFPAVATPSGCRAQPFWSSRARVEEVVGSVPAYSACQPCEVSWDDFRTQWAPGLIGYCLLIGVNWRDEPTAGHEIEPERLVLRIQSAIDNPQQEVREQT